MTRELFERSALGSRAATAGRLWFARAAKASIFRRVMSTFVRAGNGKMAAHFGDDAHISRAALRFARLPT